MTEDVNVTPVSPTPTFVASFPELEGDATKKATVDRPPFDESVQLCKELDYARHYGRKLPCLHSRHEDQFLPDAPRVALGSSEIIPYCLEDLDTPHMNEFGEKLWWAEPNPSIKTLSQQLVFGRKIVVTEDPSVHLVCSDDIIYMKPLPSYITSYAFWEYLLDSSNESIDTGERERLKATALGFLRTYAHLVQRRSDFSIAQRCELLSSFSDTSFEAFTNFIKSFDSIPDKDISCRWRFGEFHLGVLNFHCAIRKRRWHLNRFESNYGPYFQRFFPAILFMYALFSVILSAMQVIIGGRQMWDTENRGVRRVLGLFEWFSCEAIGWSLSFGLLFVLWWICIVSAEAWDRRKTMKSVKKKQAAENDVAP
ncbi:hypothetical protein CC80DRAFT_495436 [Byssothecium circinans]|uniref:Uncharacterized protein n=1 Tax=Byssothecium circinans TaxID=147558 RepID=A0A6A5THZ5_9PLEO|nr:hypothetical protein CC80DRAFT_495436 [Byssothecium circinans]